MVGVRIWSYGREREVWRAQVARGDFLISQRFISTSVALFAGDTQCFRAIKINKSDHDHIRQWCNLRKIDLNQSQCG